MTSPTPEALAEAEVIVYGGGGMDSSNAALVMRIAAALTRRDSPPGWVLVPVEPTKEMLLATAMPLLHARRAYRRMIAAVPGGER